jgi:hypothetical protein
MCILYWPFRKNTGFTRRNNKNLPPTYPIKEGGRGGERHRADHSLLSLLLSFALSFLLAKPTNSFA